MRRIAVLVAAGLTCVLAGCGAPTVTGAQTATAPTVPTPATALNSAPDTAPDSEDAHLGIVHDTDTADTAAPATAARPLLPAERPFLPPEHPGAAGSRTVVQAPAAPAHKQTATKPATGPAFTEVPARGPQLVMARPGMTGLHPVRWQAATVIDPRTVRVSFTGGSAPCDVLDSVKVDYRADAVAITLFSGSDPTQPGRMCAAVTRQQAVDVHLNSAVGERRIEDGAGAGAPASPAPTTPAGTPAPAPGPDDGATPVYAQHNTAEARPVPWDQAKVIAPQVVRIYYTSGVAPCAVLDHVRVRYTANAVQITLFQGHEPSNSPRMCPMIARRVYVDVALERPVDHRQITDGATP
ncbi:MAG TPA: hypothetical protein VGL04_11740 [Sporichthyaceae bacterium]|jgi:hypothetical protein